MGSCGRGRRRENACPHRTNTSPLRTRHLKVMKCKEVKESSKGAEDKLQRGRRKDRVPSIPRLQPDVFIRTTRRDPFCEEVNFEQICTPLVLCPCSAVGVHALFLRVDLSAPRIASPHAAETAGDLLHCSMVTTRWET